LAIDLEEKSQYSSQKMSTANLMENKIAQLEVLLKESKTKTDALMQEVEGYKQEKNALDAVVSDLKYENSHLQKELKSKEAASSEDQSEQTFRYENILRENKITIDDIRSQLREKQIEIRDLQEQVAKYEGEMVELTNTNTGLRHELEAKIAEVEERDKDYASMKGSICLAYDNQIKDLEISVKDKARQIRGLEQSNISLGEQCEEVKKALREKDNQLIGTELQKRKLEALLKEAEEKSRNLQQELSLAEERNGKEKAEATKRIQELTKSLNEAKTSAEGLINDIKETKMIAEKNAEQASRIIKDELERMKAANTKLADQNKILETTNKQQLEEMRDLKNMLDSVKSQYENLRKSLEEDQSDEGSLKNRIANLERELGEKDVKMKSLSVDLRNTSSECEKLRKELERVNERHSQTTEAESSARERADAASSEVQKLYTELEEAKRVVSSSKTENEKLQDMVERLKKSIEGKTSDNAETSRTVKDLTDRMREATRNNDAMRLELDTLKRRDKESESTINRMREQSSQLKEIEIGLRKRVDDQKAKLEDMERAWKSSEAELKTKVLEKEKQVKDLQRDVARQRESLSNLIKQQEQNNNEDFSALQREYEIQMESLKDEIIRLKEDHMRELDDMADLQLKELREIILRNNESIKRIKQESDDETMRMTRRIEDLLNKLKDHAGGNPLETKSYWQDFFNLKFEQEKSAVEKKFQSEIDKLLTGKIELENELKSCNREVTRLRELNEDLKGRIKGNFGANTPSRGPSRGGSVQILKPPPGGVLSNAMTDQVIFETMKKTEVTSRVIVGPQSPRNVEPEEEEEEFETVVQQQDFDFKEHVPGQLDFTKRGVSPPKRGASRNPSKQPKPELAANQTPSSPPPNMVKKNINIPAVHEESPDNRNVVIGVTARDRNYSPIPYRQGSSQVRVSSKTPIGRAQAMSTSPTRGIHREASRSRSRKPFAVNKAISEALAPKPVQRTSIRQQPQAQDQQQQQQVDQAFQPRLSFAAMPTEQVYHQERTPMGPLSNWYLHNKPGYLQTLTALRKVRIMNNAIQHVMSNNKIKSFYNIAAAKIKQLRGWGEAGTRIKGRLILLLKQRYADSGVRRSFLRWAMLSKPDFVRDCIIKIALTSKLNDQSVFWRFRKICQKKIKSKIPESARTARNNLASHMIHYIFRLKQRALRMASFNKIRPRVTGKETGILNRLIQNRDSLEKIAQLRALKHLREFSYKKEICVCRISDWLRRKMFSAYSQLRAHKDILEFVNTSRTRHSDAETMLSALNRAAMKNAQKALSLSSMAAKRDKLVIIRKYLQQAVDKDKGECLTRLRSFEQSTRDSKALRDRLLRRICNGLAQKSVGKLQQVLSAMKYNWRIRVGREELGDVKGRLGRELKERRIKSAILALGQKAEGKLRVCLGALQLHALLLATHKDRQMAEERRNDLLRQKMFKRLVKAMNSKLGFALNRMTVHARGQGNMLELRHRIYSSAFLKLSAAQRAKLRTGMLRLKKQKEQAIVDEIEMNKRKQKEAKIMAKALTRLMTAQEAKVKQSLKTLVEVNQSYENMKQLREKKTTFIVNRLTKAVNSKENMAVSKLRALNKQISDMKELRQKKSLLLCSRFLSSSTVKTRVAFSTLFQHGMSAFSEETKEKMKADKEKQLKIRLLNSALNKYLTKLRTSLQKLVDHSRKEHATKSITDLRMKTFATRLMEKAGASRTFNLTYILQRMKDNAQEQKTTERKMQRALVNLGKAQKGKQNSAFNQLMNYNIYVLGETKLNESRLEILADQEMRQKSRIFKKLYYALNKKVTNTMKIINNFVEYERQQDALKKNIVSNVSSRLIRLHRSIKDETYLKMKNFTKHEITTEKNKRRGVYKLITKISAADNTMMRWGVQRLRKQRADFDKSEQDKRRATTILFNRIKAGSLAKIKDSTRNLKANNDVLGDLERRRKKSILLTINKLTKALTEEQKQALQKLREFNSSLIQKNKDRLKALQTIIKGVEKANNLLTQEYLERLRRNRLQDLLKRQVIKRLVESLTASVKQLSTKCLSHLRLNAANLRESKSKKEGVLKSVLHKAHYKLMNSVVERLKENNQKRKAIKRILSKYLTMIRVNALSHSFNQWKTLKGIQKKEDLQLKVNKLISKLEDHHRTLKKIVINRWLMKNIMAKKTVPQFVTLIENLMKIRKRLAFERILAKSRVANTEARQANIGYLVATIERMIFKRQADTFYELKAKFHTENKWFQKSIYVMSIKTKINFSISFWRIRDEKKLGMSSVETAKAVKLKALATMFNEKGRLFKASSFSAISYSSLNHSFHNMPADISRISGPTMTSILQSIPPTQNDIPLLTPQPTPQKNKESIMASPTYSNKEVISEIKHAQNADRPNEQQTSLSGSSNTFNQQGVKLFQQDNPAAPKDASKSSPMSSPKPSVATMPNQDQPKQ
jgi:chromosome segregation ATPase